MAAPVLLIPTTSAFDDELTARTALKTGEVWWKIEIDDDNNGSYTDYTAYLGSNRVRVGGSGSVFKSATSGSAQFVLRNSPKLFDAGDLAGCPVKISVKIGAGEYIQPFFGYVEAFGCQREKGSLTDDTIVVSVVDPSQARGMARTADFQTLYVGKYLCKTTDTGNSLVHLFAAEMGLTPATDLDCQYGTAMETVKDYVYINKDAAYWRELQDLALLHTCLLGHRYDGKLRLARWTAAEWNSPATASEYTFDETNVHSFKAVGSDILCTRAKVEYEQWQVLDPGQIALCLESYNETTRLNAITVAAGEYWPGGTDGYAVGRLSYERAGEAFPIGVSITTPTIVKNTIKRKNATEIQYWGNGTLTLESFNGVAGTDPTKTSQNADSSEIILKNTGASSVTIVRLALNGTPIRVLSKITVQHKIAGLDDWEYVDKTLPGKYSVGRGQCERSCQRWTSFGQVARQRFEAVVDFTPHLQPGAFVVFNPTADISMYAMVEAYEHTSEGPHTRTRTKVTLVELADFTEAAGDSDMRNVARVGNIASAGTISGVDIDVSTLAAEHFAFAGDGSSVVFDGWDRLPTGGELFDLRQPDCLSHLGRAPTSKETIFFPGSIKDELGTAHDNDWAKFSALGAIGVFGVTTNLVTDPEDLSASSWAESNVDQPTDSGYTLQGRKLWLVQNASAAAGYEHQSITVTAAVHAVQAVIKKSTTNGPIVRVYDGATLRCRIDVDFSGATPTATCSTGTLAFAKAIGADAIHVGAITTAFAGTTASLRIYTGSSTDNDNVYATAVQLELLAFPTPYTPTSRAANSLSYAAEAGDTGTIECWARQWATYDYATTRYLWCFGGTEDNAIALLYDPASDKYTARLRIDAGNYVSALSTAAITTNAELWAWHHFKVVWDIPNETIALYVDGVEQTGAASAGSVSSLVPASVLAVGGRGGGAYNSRALFVDLLWQDGTEDTSTTHYTNAVPWYDPSEVANAAQSVRINRSGIRMHNAELTITDDYNRLIEVSNQAGLLVKDAGGTITHNIPTAPLLVGAYPMGHLYLFKYDNAAYTLVDTSSPTTGSYVTQAALKLNNQSVNGVRLKIYVAGYDSSKAVPAFVWIMLRPSGSTWGYAMTDMAVADYSYISVGSGATFAYVRRGCELDVPVNADGEFDYYLELTPKITSLSLLIQQQGVWI